MLLAEKTRFGPYEIVSLLGAGGMGEVYAARDTRLDRTVAIKICKGQITERFEREARAISSLNHPHICALYDIGREDSIDFLVMEFLEGESLEARLRRGALPIEEALRIAIQIAGALDAAHRKGVVHRDLKPGNVMLTRSGAKLLDFGLAKTAVPVVSSEADTLTAAAPITAKGTILGTFQYMSPEQLEGKEADARSDIFSFGAMLYEMMTGRKCFEGSSHASLIAAVMSSNPPPVSTIQPLASPALDRVLKKCLAKSPDDRWQSAGDLLSELEWIAETGSNAGIPAPVTAKRSNRDRLAWLAAGLAVAALGIGAAGGLAFVHLRDKPPESPMVRLSLQPPANYRFIADTPPAISPDGRKIVFEAVSADGRRQLWLRPLDSLTAQPLVGTEGGSYPFWSPDNKSIGFFAAGKLKKVDASGGPVTTLADASTPRGGTWSPKGVIVFSPTPYGLMRIPAAGGAVQSATNLEGKALTRFPWFLPDGTHFLYLARRLAESQVTIQIGSLTSPMEERALSEAADSFAIYAKGHLLFMIGHTLMARPFDEKRLEFTGEPVPVAEPIKLVPGALKSGEFSGSASGDLVYFGGLGNLRLTWLDRAGKHLGTLGDPAQFNGVQFSPDRKTVGVWISDADGNNDIWLFDTVRGLRTRFTSDPAPDSFPIWSPDGRTIVFDSNRKGPSFDFYRKPADGSRGEELLYADKLVKVSPSLSPDGKYLAYLALGDPKTGSDIWILRDPLGTPGAAKPYPFLRTEYDESNPQFSPDGRWIAYESNESGRNEVYLAPSPGPGAKQQVSPAGGTSPRWRKDGKELFYLAPDGRLTAAEVDLKAGAVEVKKVEPLFGLLSAGYYDVSADGQRFLVPLPPEEEIAEPLTVVLNWTAGLKK
jgi:serine/threonine protein kinase